MIIRNAQIEASVCKHRGYEPFPVALKSSSELLVPPPSPLSLCSSHGPGCEDEGSHDWSCLPHCKTEETSCIDICHGLATVKYVYCRVYRHVLHRVRHCHIEAKAQAFHITWKLAYTAVDVAASCPPIFLSAVQ